MTPTITRKETSARGSAGRATGWRLRRVQGLEILESCGLARLDWLVHGFSTRLGGVGRSRALNLGFTDGASRVHVAENRTRFLKALGAGGMRFVTLRQIHSDIAYRVERSNAAALAEEPPWGDALLTRETAILIAVQTADCIPILLADAKQRAVAAIHSGWRGTMRRIAAKTIGQMQMQFGTRPEDVMAVLGPGIGRCCYEVGSEVAREFHAQFARARQWFDGPFDALAFGENDPNWLPWLTMRPPGHPLPRPKVNLDLLAANRAILAEAGVPVGQISVSGLCTACRSDLFFSYRREGPTGRLVAAIGLRE